MLVWYTGALLVTSICARNNRVGSVLGLNISWKGNPPPQKKNDHKTTFNGMFIYVQDVCLHVNT